MLNNSIFSTFTLAVMKTCDVPELASTPTAHSQGQKSSTPTEAAFSHNAHCHRRFKTTNHSHDVRQDTSVLTSSSTLLWTKLY